MKHIIVLFAAVGVIGLGSAAPAPMEKFYYVSLESKTNLKFTDNLGAGRDGSDLKGLPTGEQTFGDIKFKLKDGLIQLGSSVAVKMPEKVEGIKVDKACGKIHILHATCFGGGPNTEGTQWFVKDDTVIGEYNVNFDDKTSETIPIVYGKDVRDWFYINGEKDVSRGKTVWNGDNELATAVGAKIRIYMTTWINPKSDKKVVSIDYISKKNDTVAAPFCLAITLEAK